MIDFRPLHNQLRNEILRGGIMWMLGSLATFILWIAMAAYRGLEIALLDLVGLFLTMAPIFVLLYVLLNVRAIVARPEGLEVDGELVPWNATSNIELAFFSRLFGLPNPARAWITVAGRGWTSSLMVVADPTVLDAMAKMRAATLFPPPPPPVPAQLPETVPSAVLRSMPTLPSQGVVHPNA